LQKLCIIDAHQASTSMSTYQTRLNRTELEVYLAGATAPDEYRRLQVLLSLADGTPLAEIVASTGYRPRSIRQIAQRYLELGAAALVDRRAFAAGVAPLLSAVDQEELRQALQQSPPGGGAWTGPKVACWIAAKTGKSVHRQRGWEYLRRLKAEPPAK
jgi:transposase